MRNTQCRDRTQPKRVVGIGYTESLRGKSNPDSIPVPERHFTPLATALVTPPEVFVDIEGFKREVIDGRD